MCVSVCLSVCLSDCLSDCVCLSACLSVRPSAVRPSVCLPLCRRARLYACVHACILQTPYLLVFPKGWRFVLMLLRPMLLDAVCFGHPLALHTLPAGKGKNSSNNSASFSRPIESVAFHCEGEFSRRRASEPRFPAICCSWKRCVCDVRAVDKIARPAYGVCCLLRLLMCATWFANKPRNKSICACMCVHAHVRASGSFIFACAVAGVGGGLTTSVLPKPSSSHIA